MDPKYGFLFVIGLLAAAATAKSLSNSKDTKKHSCKLLELPLQEELDTDKMEGKWYGMAKTGTGSGLLSFFMEIYDGRILFKKNYEGGFDLKAFGSKFYGGWCPKGKGKAVVPDKDYPERMTMFFDTSIGRKIGMKPGWILKTDYDNYAIIYSCWDVLSDGTCDPNQTYAVVIQRSTKSLPSDKQCEVDHALKSACVDQSKLSPVKHYGYCQSEEL